MIFGSDNWSGAAPAIADALAKHATGFAPAYGASDLDLALERRFDDLFEREVAVFFVSTGTAANALALSAINRPGGFTLCHREAHLIEDECGAPEFFTSGGRLAPVDGPLGKMSPESLAAELGRFDPEFVHHGQPMAVSLAQSTEAGAVYTVDEIRRLAELSHSAGVPLHMDGARFANAVAHLGVSPADMTWRAGVDVLSFGATKNGCWCAEALVFFDKAMAKQVPYIRKRAAQLLSKTRFIAAQLHAYLGDGLWLDLAYAANRQAQRLAAGISASDVARLAWPTESNELFVIMPKQTAEQLRERGAWFYPWRTPHAMPTKVPADHGLYRLVTSFSTTDKDVDAFVSTLAECSSAE